MKNKILFYILTFLFLVGSGCATHRSDQPGELEVTDSLISLIADVHLLEAQLTRERASGKKTDSLADQRYDSLFARYHTTKTGYERILKQLTLTPDRFVEAYDSVIQRLNKLEKETE
ncbi:MAG: DUF4296 domain-containing protein [Bacteroidales bacterium]|nr:DUF4296 domain-containing protein [Bacteroidales bacterium]MDD3666906.1 DUF4296 domain-containing protein [Bacteroidales bacterium]